MGLLALCGCILAASCERLTVTSDDITSERTKREAAQVKAGDVWISQHFSLGVKAKTDETTSNPDLPAEPFSGYIGIHWQIKVLSKTGTTVLDWAFVEARDPKNEKVVKGWLPLETLVRCAKRKP